MNENIAALLKLLDPRDNLTGGGTASALAGAMAAALVAMVARLSVGKKGMEKDAYYRSIDSEATALSRELFAGGRRDLEAFEAVRASCKLRSETEAQKKVRQAAIQRAIVQAAQVPLTNSEGCKRVLDLCMRLKGRSNPNVGSDLECARHLARAGVLGCLANVETNLSSIQDRELATELASKTRTLRNHAQMNENHE